MYVYAIHNLENGKKYIGQTTGKISKRYHAHFTSSRCEDCKFYRALRKYGKDAFVYYQVDTADSIDERNEKEIYWINKLDTIRNGYNTKEGGDNARHSKETCKKISKSRKGIKFSEEHCKNLSKAGKLRDTSHLDPWKKRKGQLAGENHHFYGKKRPEMAAKQRERLKDGHPEEVKRKISESLKGKMVGEKHWTYNRELSEEHKENCRKAASKKAIKCLETGEVFESISEASRKLNLHVASIAKVVNGQRNSLYGMTFIKISEVD